MERLTVGEPPDLETVGSAHTTVQGEGWGRSSSPEPHPLDVSCCYMYHIFVIVDPLPSVDRSVVQGQHVGPEGRARRGRVHVCLVPPWRLPTPCHSKPDRLHPPTRESKSRHISKRSPDARVQGEETLSLLNHVDTKNFGGETEVGYPGVGPPPPPSVT